MLLYKRNVNEAWDQLKGMLGNGAHRWRDVSPRGLPTKEWPGPVMTQYSNPQERVLFDPMRDANPFFHFFESLWILAGRNDVGYLKKFNPKMADFSDDGVTFHGAYGHRLTRHRIDQLEKAIELLKADNNTRQVVLQIWDSTYDLGRSTKDLPCNDMIFLKIREGALDITVCCRSNDVIWGAYGANVVQFSVLQEYLASAIGVGIGRYTQFSDSFHVYVDNPIYKKIVATEQTSGSTTDEYTRNEVVPFPLFETRVPKVTFTEYQLSGEMGKHAAWMCELHIFMQLGSTPPKHFAYTFPFFDLARQMMSIWENWEMVKGMPAEERNRALTTIRDSIANPNRYDWLVAADKWLERRYK